jgi:hypothetical protein
MSQASRSIQVFGFYLAVAGLLLAAVPNTLLPLLGFRTSTEIWVRMVGLLTLILAFYFLHSVRYDDRPFYRATVTARVVFFSGATLFVLLGLAGPMLIAFGLVDLVGAAWTWSALRSS